MGDATGRVHTGDAGDRAEGGEAPASAKGVRDIGRQARDRYAPHPYPQVEQQPPGSALTAPAGTPTRRARRAFLGASLVGLLIIGALLAWFIAPSLMIASHRMVPWQLQGFPGRVSNTAATGTTLEVFIASWPTEFTQGDDSWLEQRVIETPLTVTVTLHTSDAYESLPWQRGWYDTGGSVMVHLSAPLAGRLLFDGSGFPPEPRSVHGS